MEYNKEQLVKLILEDKLTYKKIGKMLGVSDVSVRRAAKRLGIELPKRKQIHPKEKFCKYCGKKLTQQQIHAGNIYCSQECDISRKFEENITKWKENPDFGYAAKNFKPKGFIKRYLIQKHGGCQACGCNLSNPYTRLSILQVHHINGDPSDNREENLKLLCPNCHAMTDNWGAMNKNCIEGRSAYYHTHNKNYKKKEK